MNSACPFPLNRTWAIDEAAFLACSLEAVTPKLGNVYPGADFCDMTFEHFQVSSLAISRTIAELQSSTPGSKQTVGQTVLRCVRAMRQAVNTNTHLGTILLVAPLAHAVIRARRKHALDNRSDTQPESEPHQATPLATLHDEIGKVLAELDQAEESQRFYEAIRLANPGGLGKTEAHDIHSSPPTSLLAAMGVVAEHDAVARQYINNFADILDQLLPWLNQEIVLSDTPQQAIARLQLRCMASQYDGLIIRKAGQQIAREVREKTKQVWEQTAPDTSASVWQSNTWKKLDAFMRVDGNKLNPGTTADLIAATLFVRLTCGQ